MGISNIFSSPAVVQSEFSMYPDFSFFLTLTGLWTSTLSGCPQHSTSAPESSALKSLECRNDYRTHIHCSWRDDPHIPLSLIHMDPDDHRVSPCVQTPKPSQNPAGRERVSCRYNTSLFAIGFDDVFFFHTPHSSGISKTFRLTKFEDAHPDWIFQQLDDPSRLISDPFRLQEQESSVELNQEIVKDQKAGKIFTKSAQKDVEVSKNKTDEGPQLISEYPLPGPSNLHCVLNGEKNLSCSWDLKTDLARYISYTLSYRTHSTALAEWCCVEKVEVINKGDFLRTVGVFSIFEPGELQVQLTPTPVTKVIRSYEHIQPSCPTGLSVELRGEDWILNWTLTKYRTVPLTTELKYWSIQTPEDVKSIFFSDGETVFAISEHSLQGSSEYQAQVRCNVSAARRSGWRYTGYPSEWTDPVYWTTRPGLSRPHHLHFYISRVLHYKVHCTNLIYICFCFRASCAQSSSVSPVFPHRDPRVSCLHCSFHHSGCSSEKTERMGHVSSLSCPQQSLRGVTGIQPPTTPPSVIWNIRAFIQRSRRKIFSRRHFFCAMRRIMRNDLESTGSRDSFFYKAHAVDCKIIIKVQYENRKKYIKLQAADFDELISEDFSLLFGLQTAGEGAYIL